MSCIYTCKPGFVPDAVTGECKEFTCPSITPHTCKDPTGKDLCVNKNSEPFHCGECGNSCPQGNACINGACSACPAGTTFDGASRTCKCLDFTKEFCAGVNRCVDTKTDPSNCGACGNSCASGQTCTNGQCQGQCQAGTGSFKASYHFSHTGGPGSVTLDGFMEGTLIKEPAREDGRIPYSLTGTWHVIFDYHNIGPFGSQHVYDGPASTDPASEEDHIVLANPQIIYDPVSNTFSGQIIAQYRTTPGAEPLVQFIAPIRAAGRRRTLK